jgi:hypothetical protein
MRGAAWHAPAGRHSPRRPSGDRYGVTWADQTQKNQGSEEVPACMSSGIALAKPKRIGE